MYRLVKCYHPPANITHLADYILVPEDKVYDHTKELYEKGLDRKVNPPQIETELHEFFRWKVRYLSMSKILKWVVDILIDL